MSDIVREIEETLEKKSDNAWELQSKLAEVVGGHGVRAQIGELRAAERLDLLYTLEDAMHEAVASDPSIEDTFAFDELSTEIDALQPELDEMGTYRRHPRPPKAEVRNTWTEESFGSGIAA